MSKPITPGELTSSLSGRILKFGVAWAGRPGMISDCPGKIRLDVASDGFRLMICWMVVPKASAMAASVSPGWTVYFVVKSTGGYVGFGVGWIGVSVGTLDVEVGINGFRSVATAFVRPGIGVTIV